MGVTFADPEVSQMREYVPDKVMPQGPAIKTRQGSNFMSALLKSKHCDHCICSKNEKANVQCDACGKWEVKRKRDDFCQGCVRGVLREHVPCTECGEWVHRECYDQKEDVLCTKCMPLMPPVQTPDQRLHVEGFAIYRKVFTLDDDTMDMIRESRYFPIFNGVDGDKVTYDGKRVMAEGEWRSTFRKKLKQFLKEKGFMTCADGTKTVQDVYALRSLPGCPIQPKHCDSALEETLRDEDSTNVPLAVLYAIEPDTKLKIWRFDHEYPSVVNLNPTDLVIFRGDAAHAGYQYDKVNTRLHAYIDSSAPRCKRVKGKTYILSDDKYVRCMK